MCEMIQIIASTNATIPIAIHKILLILLIPFKQLIIPISMTQIAMVIDIM